jgi:hypothetical protein
MKELERIKRERAEEVARKQVRSPPRAYVRGLDVHGASLAPPPPSLAHASSARNQAEEETAELAEKHAVLATGNPLVAGGGSFNIKRRCARAQGSAEGTTAAAQNA